MPQVVVDIAAESSQSLRLLSKLLGDYAILRQHEENTAQYFAAPPPIAPTETLPTGPLEPDPAEVFGKSNVLPFPSAPPVPVASSAESQTPTAIPTAAAVPSTATAIAPPTAATPLEYDCDGVPWDARIHQTTKGRNKKGVGTWKVKKGMDHAVVAAVLAEISPKPGTAVPVVLPVTVPAAGTVPVPPAATSVPVVPPAPASVPVPPSAQSPAGSVPASPLIQFNAMMKRIGDALQAKTITQEQVQAAHIKHGVAQIQLAITRPAAIPHILAELGL